MTLLKATVLVVTVVVNVVHVFDVVLNVVMIIMYLFLVNKKSSEAPGSYCYCWVGWVSRYDEQITHTMTYLPDAPRGGS